MWTIALISTPEGGTGCVTTAVWVEVSWGYIIVTPRVMEGECDSVDSDVHEWTGGVED